MIHFFVCIFALLLLSSCQEQEQLSTVTRYVRYEKAISTSDQTSRVFTGVSKAGVISKLSFPVSGLIIDLPVKVGEQVKKGQVIAQLNPSSFQIKVGEAEAILIEQKARERQATSEYERSRELYETKSISKAELETARAQYESARALVLSKGKSLEQAKIQLNDTILRAPQNGEISSVKGAVNENVTIGQEVVEFISLDDIDIELAVPETIINEIAIGQNVFVTFPSLGDKIYNGHITEISSSSALVSTFPITIRLIDHDQSILSGMSAEVTLTFPSKQSIKGVWVKPNSVLNEQDKNFVFVIHPSESDLGVLEKREVEIGELQKEGIVITSGVKPNELILNAGLRFAQDKMIVRLLNEEEKSK